MAMFLLVQKLTINHFVLDNDACYLGDVVYQGMSTDIGVGAGSMENGAGPTWLYLKARYGIRPDVSRKHFMDQNVSSMACLVCPG
eukprot:13293119-Ditylum_brightwellii.AAC.1